MPTIHYLNVQDGDCSVIQHASEHVTAIDVCNARKEEAISKAPPRLLEALLGVQKAAGSGNLNQKSFPVNPIQYLKNFGILSVFRFILTHPEMDHMDGIKDFFEAFSPLNFWDSNNSAEKTFEEGSPYREDDWKFYKSLRDGSPTENPRRLTLYSGMTGQYWNNDGEGKGGGDGLHILAPTPELVRDSNETDDYNDCSYVILYSTGGNRIVFAGDSHDKTWEHILANHKDVTDIDLLIAPHHGRKSSRNYDFLDVLKPKLTFFGNAPSEHLARFIHEN